MPMPDRSDDPKLAKSPGICLKGISMAYIGQQLENPVTGEKLTFVETAASTNGERVVVDLELVAGGKGPGGHGHPNQEEKVEGLAGPSKVPHGHQKKLGRAGRDPG